jgi:hypothetical protein
MKIEIDPRNIEEEIRCRAYELYKQRRKRRRHDLDDWLRAPKRNSSSEGGSTAA